MFLSTYAKYAKNALILSLQLHISKYFWITETVAMQAFKIHVEVEKLG